MLKPSDDCCNKLEDRPWKTEEQAEGEKVLGAPGSKATSDISVFGKETFEYTLSYTNMISAPFSHHHLHPASKMPLFKLPDELLIEIVEHLRSTYKHESLASLNQACRRLRDVTVSPLYRTLILFRTDTVAMKEEEILEPIGEWDPVPEVWKHTR
jgi:hypothetical protein